MRALDKKRPRAHKRREEIETPARLVPIFAAAVADEVASSLRHDFVNHLSAISNTTFRLRPLVGENAEAVALLQKMTDRVATAVAAISRDVTLPASPPESLDPRARAAALVEATTPPSGVRLERLGSGFSGRIHASADEVDLALHCVLRNALEATLAAGGGTVRTRVGVRDGWVEIEILDEGAGLTGDARDRAFEPFFTTKPGHLGLGLSIVKRIAYRSGARVDLATGKSGGGSVFLRWRAVDA